MRPALRLIAAAMLVGACGRAVAEPVSAPRFTLTVARLEGAAFSGLAEHEGGLVVTNLADGRLYRFAEDRFEAFGIALPHGLDVIGDPTGPYRIASTAGGLLVSQGWTPKGAAPTPLDHALLALGTGLEPRVVSADFWNPLDFIIRGEEIVVVDAARNSVERLAADGSRTTLVAFQRLKQPAGALQSLSPTEFSGGEEYETDAVPTAIDAENSRFYVTLFGGFPYMEGAGRVVSFAGHDTGTKPRTELAGLNAPVDLSVQGGHAWILEHGRYDQATGFLPETGRLLVADLDSGVQEIVADRLTRPVSFLIRADGTIVIAGLDGTLTFLAR